MTTTTVLIIDDHPLFNDGLALILKQFNDFQVVGQVYDSRQALHQFQLLKPDLVIVDFNMPYLDGLQVIKQLKRYLNTCKVVVVSMYADSKELLMFKEEGINGFLPKTIHPNQLCETLRVIMDGESVFRSTKVEKPEVVKDHFLLKYRLSKREVEILKAIKAGNSSEQVAELLHLSYYTVETHRKNINLKLNLKSRQELFDFLEKINF
jgi:DNA-binding NarL/FixJ family response regulator